MQEENPIVPLSPVNFFQINADIFHLPSSSFPSLTGSNIKKYRLPDTSALCSEDRFADVAIAWSNEGIEIYAHVHHPFEKASYPDVSEGDSLEIFIDTRDVKTSGFNTRFCHHFFFLPEEVDGHQAGEITKFRTEDAHELCPAEKLSVMAKLKKEDYILQIFIPSQCLNGYDVEQFRRIGFTYRVNRYHGNPQHFSVTTDDYQLEQQPSLWSSLQLIK